MSTILIVDDHATNRELLVTLLSYEGHLLLEADSGPEALDLLQRERPDLIIADIVMPTMDGYEFVRRLRAMPAIAHTRVIFYTATYNDHEARALAQTCGVEHLLPKPADPQLILTTVAVVLEQPAAASGGSPFDATFERDHTRLLTDKLASKVEELEETNRRLAQHTAILEQEVAARKQIERWQTLQVAVTRILADSDTRYEAIPLLVATIGASLDCVLTELWRGPNQTGMLSWEHGWHSRSALDSAQIAPARLSAPIPLDHGICARAWASAQPEWSELSAGDPIAPPSPVEACQVLVAPIRGGDVIVGMLAFFWTELSTFDTSWPGQMADIGSMIGQFFERKHAEEQLRHYTQRLRTLHAIDREILALQSPEAMTQATLRHIRHLIPCQYVSISGIQSIGGQACIWAVAGDASAGLPVGAHYALEAIPMLHMLQQGEPCALEDCDTETAESLFPLLERNRFRSILIAPLFVPNHLIGVLTLAAAQPSAYTTEHSDIACEIGTHLAIAIQNIQLFQQIQDGRTRLQQLSHQLVRAQEEERRHLARELHDEIGQALTATQLNLQVLLSVQDPRELAKRLEDSIVLVEHLLQQVRALSLDLRPSMLDDLGLAPALRWYLSRQAERTGLAVSFAAEPSEMRLPAEIETTCFRIAQEALTNIVRHAHATHITVQLHQLYQQLQLLICDDGIGFDTTAAHGRAVSGTSLGLLSMHERALLIGGHVTIESEPGLGTRVCLRVSLPDPLGQPVRIERRKDAR
jgi:signal transduction histidine kinase/DNA-binding response OmpR family regulator